MKLSTVFRPMWSASTWYGPFQPSAFTAASASARTLSGCVWTIRCSRFDLFQTGTMSTPSALASISARSCACPWRAKRSPIPMLYFERIIALLPSGMEWPMERRPTRLKAETHPEQGRTQTSAPAQDANASSVEDAVGGPAVSRRNRLFPLATRPMPRSSAHRPLTLCLSRLPDWSEHRTFRAGFALNEFSGTETSRRSTCWLLFAHIFSNLA